MLNSYIFFPDIVFLTIHEFNDHFPDEIIDGRTLAIDVPYLSVNLNKLIGPSIVHTRSVSSVSSWVTGEITSKLLLLLLSFLCCSFRALLCCKLYINPRRFTFLKTRFQCTPPRTQNSNFVQLKSSVCIRERLYHPRSTFGLGVLNCSNIKFSSRSDHIPCLM